MTAAPLRHRGAPLHFRVSFFPAAQMRALEAGASAPTVTARMQPGEADGTLEEELRALRRELQASIEAFETSNEELHASNEEVTSVNEELQSTNEELETGHEELQTLNEELTTVNAQLQTKLVELEALTSDLDNLLSSTDIAVVFLDTQLHVRRFTPAVRDLLELIPSDIGRPLADLAQKFNDAGDLIAEAREVIAQLQPRDSEVLSNSGRWYQRRTLLYRTEDARVSGVVITFVDITARKHAEQAIETAQARLQAMIEQMPAAVLMAEAPSGAILFANHRAAALFNQPFPLPYLGHSWTATYAALRGLRPDGRPYELHEWPLARALAAGETVLDEELDFTAPDDVRRTLSMSAAPMLNTDGAVVGAVAAFWDITERKRAEAALRDSEEHFRTLVESAHDYAIFMLEPSGRIVSWNQGAERVTGYSEQEILGQSGAVLFTPEDRAAGVPEKELARATELGRVIDERWHVRKDGSHFWASGVATMACDDDGTLRGFVIIIRDQSERKVSDARLQEALQSAQQLRARAEGANRAKDEFISTVSHELRTPLNTIRLWSRMFMSGKVRDNDIIEGAKMIDRAALAQQQLIEDLLDVSRMASGQLRLTPRDTQLTQAAQSAIEAVRPLAESRQITLEVNLSPDVGVVRADPDRIQQVMWNLLANAVKFTPDGGRIDVNMRRVNGSVEIEVSDLGAGIRADFLPHVFDRFRQGDASSARRYGGLGLGLSIAKQLVELHGGTITARSEGEGRGATFTVYLPLERGEATAQPPAPEPDLSATSDLREIDVLLVEDDTMAREVMQRLLAQYGIQVRAVNSAARGREAFEIRRPDLVMADIGMPDEDGYSLLVSLRLIEREQGTARVPAIAVTAFARSEDRQRALAAGFDDHLQKPVDPERLIAALAKLVHEQRSRS